MTWEICVGIIAIVTVGIAVGKVVYDSGRSSAKLSCSIDALNDTLSKIDRANIREHDRFKADIKDHERRIQTIEDKNKMKGIKFYEKEL